MLPKMKGIKDLPFEILGRIGNHVRNICLSFQSSQLICEQVDNPVELFNFGKACKSIYAAVSPTLLRTLVLRIAPEFQNLMDVESLLDSRMNGIRSCRVLKVDLPLNVRTNKCIHACQVPPLESPDTALGKLVNRPEMLNMILRCIIRNMPEHKLRHFELV